MKSIRQGVIVQSSKTGVAFVSWRLLEVDSLQNRCSLRVLENSKSIGVSRTAGDC